MQKRIFLKMNIEYGSYPWPRDNSQYVQYVFVVYLQGVDGKTQSLHNCRIIYMIYNSLIYFNICIINRIELYDDTIF